MRSLWPSGTPTQQFLWVKSLVANKMVAVLPGSDAFVTNLHSVLQ